MENAQEEKIKMLECRIITLEQVKNVSYDRKVFKDSPGFKCKECSEAFSKKHILKSRILALHPMQYSCTFCDESFDTSISLEVHLKIHALDKLYKCDICGKTFHMQWRLKKHTKQHQSINWKYCHFYNNNKFCIFEDIG